MSENNGEKKGGFKKRPRIKHNGGAERAASEKPSRKPVWTSSQAAEGNNGETGAEQNSKRRKGYKPRNKVWKYNGLKGSQDIIINKINRRKHNQAPPEPKHDGTTRLNKYISNSGICSRRDADKLIEAGAISVNGEVVTVMGYKVKEGDVVSYSGQVLRSEPKRYFLLNKPKGYITTLDDPYERRTVMLLVQDCCKERIYPVGRLDRNTTGLLLFTNDGELAKHLTHPSSNVYKIYQVECDRPVSRNDMKQMLEGVELEDGVVAVDDVQYQADSNDRRVVGVALHSGKNRVVRRIFESLGYEVVKLDRVVFAGLTKKDLPRGHVRELTQQEINFLRMV